MKDQPAAKRRFGCLHLFLAVLIAIVLTAVVSFFVFKRMLFPTSLQPVELSQIEKQVLQAKVDRLDVLTVTPAPSAGQAPLQPEPYTEEGADRSIRFSTREINALLALNTDLADKLAIDLSEDLFSAKLLIPLDEDVPVLGGKTLKVKTGVTFRFADGRPEVRLKGVSVMGVPMPNAWLGGMKNIDVIQEFGDGDGFWKAFADGVEDLRVENGQIAITLKE